MRWAWLMLGMLAVFGPSAVFAKTPPACAHWPQTMALASLKNAGVVDPATIDEAATKTVLMAAAPLGHSVFREVYDIIYRDRGGHSFEVITSSDASDEECSMSGVTTFLVAKRLGGAGER